MKKKLFHLLLAGSLLASMTLDVCAETSYGGSDWKVIFTDDKKMESSFRTSDINDTIDKIQPGDNAIVELSLKNENSTPTDWYMTNKVLYSLEDRSANSGATGGAYTYRLTYTDKDGRVTTFFDSDTVGGDQASGGREGLHEATAALEDYFYLDTLDTGDSGRIILEVTLEGETQGNDYQNTLADLQMNFAVEMNPDAVREREKDSVTNRTGQKRGTSVVQTGDESNLTPFIIASSISGMLFLLLSMYGLVEKKKEEKKEGT